MLESRVCYQLEVREGRLNRQLNPYYVFKAEKILLFKFEYDFKGWTPQIRARFRQRRGLDDDYLSILTQGIGPCHGIESSNPRYNIGRNRARHRSHLVLWVLQSDLALAPSHNDTICESHVVAPLPTFNIPRKVCRFYLSGLYMPRRSSSSSSDVASITAQVVAYFIQSRNLNHFDPS